MERRWNAGGGQWQTCKLAEAKAKAGAEADRGTEAEPVFGWVFVGKLGRILIALLYFSDF